MFPNNNHEWLTSWDHHSDRDKFSGGGRVQIGQLATMLTTCYHPLGDLSFSSFNEGSKVNPIYGSESRLIAWIYLELNTFWTDPIPLKASL